MHEDSQHVDLAAVHAWTAETQVPPTHAGLTQAIRARAAAGGDMSPLLSALETRRDTVKGTLLELEASRDVCDLLAPDLLAAIEHGVLAMRAYVDALDEALATGGAVDEGWLQRLDDLQGSMVSAHHGLAAASLPDTVHLPLAAEVAGVPNLRALHRMLQAYLNGHASLDRARAAVADLAARFADARVQWTAPPPEAADGAVVAELLLIAYEVGVESLALLETRLPTLDCDGLVPAWQMLEGAFTRIQEAQALRTGLEDELELDFLSDD